MEEESYNLEEEYEKLSKKYDLPGFGEVSEDFEIEKLSEKESKYLLREMRRVFSEKLSAYMHFFEMIINPSSPPLFIFPMLKKIEKKTIEKINEIYKILSKFQIESMKLDTVYDEKTEAEFIKEVFRVWQKVKKEIYEIIEKFEVNLEENAEETKAGYFG